MASHKQDLTQLADESKGLLDIRGESVKVNE